MVSKKRFVRKGNYINRKSSTAKFPAKITCWAGISCRGATEIVMMDQGVNVDSELYCAILEEAFIPFNEKVYAGLKKTLSHCGLRSRYICSRQRQKSYQSSFFAVSERQTHRDSWMASRKPRFEPDRAHVERTKTVCQVGKLLPFD